jgi:hypothetical protein
MIPLINNMNLNNDFNEQVRGRDLTDVATWIRKQVELGRIDLGDLFSAFALDEWAKENGYEND